jgi:hypothetical protein
MYFPDRRRATVAEDFVFCERPPARTNRFAVQARVGEPPISQKRVAAHVK